MLRATIATTVVMIGLMQHTPGAPFAPRTFSKDGKVMPYRLFVPDAAARRLRGTPAGRRVTMTALPRQRWV